MSLTQAATDVIAERTRQVEVEGFTAEFDDEYKNYELAKAAACYAFGSAEILNRTHRGSSMIWPWHISWWKSGITAACW